MQNNLDFDQIYKGDYTVRVKVSDTGVGMSKLDCQNVFVPFYRSECEVN